MFLGCYLAALTGNPRGEEDMPNGIVSGTSGNDVIEVGYTGDPEGDLIDAGDGINGSVGDEDVVRAGDGNDAVLSGEGDDTIYGEDGDDLLQSENGDDKVFGGEGEDTIKTGDGNDIALGEDDDDKILGEDGNDLLVGGEGQDILDGGADDDILTGGTRTGGDGDDSMYGGAGSDRFDVGTGGGTKTVEGDAYSGLFGLGGPAVDPDDIDVLRLGGDATITLDNGTVFSGTPGQDFDLGALGSETGQAVLADGTVVNFNEIETIKIVDPETIICFTPGTMIATAQGERDVLSLKVGDTVITRDNGLRKIAWVGQKSVDPMMMHAHPGLRPVLIKAGSLGQNMPDRDIMVSPNHRMLVANEMTSLLFDESETLVSAKHLVGKTGIQRALVPSTTYVHILFENHEVVLANGAWSESFQPGDYSMDGLENGQRSEILQLFPELAEMDGLTNYASARRSLKRHEAELLARY
jgi:hypothetical protein